MPTIIMACSQATATLNFALLHTRINQTSEDLESARIRLAEMIRPLPEALQHDIDRVVVEIGTTADFNVEIEKYHARVNELRSQRDHLINRINTKIDNNGDGTTTLTAFRSSPAGNEKKLWYLKDNAEIPAIIGQLTKWHNIITLWGVSAELIHFQNELKQLPPEDDLLANLKQLDKELYKVSANIVKGNWFEQAKNLSTEVVKEAHQFVSALRQLGESQNKTDFKTLKDSEERNRNSALSVFPAWATTNLSAKNNFLLTPGFFDIVILDEASQCDIASALPILYRAKRIVIVGDPNQLRHVATLYQESDTEAAAKHSVPLEAFSYRDLSLFDVAKRSSGNRPGTILLNEHHRSDPRIIAFSNKEFYSEQLTIRTDMRRLGFPEEFLKVGSGVFWINVEGIPIRLPDRSGAYNLGELSVIQKLVPKIMATLQKYKIANATLGIVTPYVLQEDRLNTWLEQQKPQIPEEQVLAGTAHKFQGGERDIVIFSIVIGSEMSQGSLDWLINKSNNLLNVALTRARSTLIIVGNLEFCRSLPLSSKYRKLADYVSTFGGHVVSTFDSLPMFTGETFDVIGTLLDRHDTHYNRTTLRKLILSCKEFVWWVDPYMTDQVFELLLDVSQHPEADLHDIRILSMKEQTEGIDGKSPQLTYERAKAVQSELKRKGINLEVGLLPKKVLPHDRYLYSSRYSINMPPFSGAYGNHKMISEYTPSKTTSEFFLQYWNQAEKI